MFISIVIGNSIVLSLFGNTFPETTNLDLANDIFTYLFLVEFSMKLMGFGVSEYFSDISNYLDLIVVVSGLIDIELRNFYMDWLSNHPNPFAKFIRILRVIRIMRLLRNMKAMRRILHGIYNSLLKIIYVLSLLILFILIYMILGMS